MTSASELFNNRRYRFGRNPIELGTFDSSSSAAAAASADGLSHHNRRRNSHHNHGARRRHHDLDGCDLPRRTDNNHISRRTSLERESVRFDQGGRSASSQSIPGNVVSQIFTNIPSRERFGRSDRLPGAVVLARERLLERLRGISSTGPRNSGDWRMLAGLNLSNSSDSDSDMGPFLALEGTKYRHPGLTQDALDQLHIEVFTTTKKDDEENISTASLECSICLENFLEGAELVRLPCGHKYHQSCLYPWVRVCGDCPYCRAAISL